MSGGERCPLFTWFQRVNAETAIFTAGYVILTMIINAPLCGPLMTALKLDRISEEQVHMRRHVSLSMLAVSSEYRLLLSSESPVR
jgi:hypothetical protein